MKKLLFLLVFSAFALPLFAAEKIGVDNYEYYKGKHFLFAPEIPWYKGYRIGNQRFTRDHKGKTLFIEDIAPTKNKRYIELTLVDQSQKNSEKIEIAAPITMDGHIFLSNMIVLENVEGVALQALPESEDNHSSKMDSIAKEALVKDNKKKTVNPPMTGKEQYPIREKGYMPFIALKAGASLAQSNNDSDVPANFIIAGGVDIKNFSIEGAYTTFSSMKFEDQVYEPTLLLDLETFMFNLYYHFYVYENSKLFLGAGVGLASSDSDKALALSGYFGSSTPFTPTTDLLFQIKYLNTQIDHHGFYTIGIDVGLKFTL